jgi:hypothetical protein
MYHQNFLIYLIGEFINILLPLPADLFAHSYKTVYPGASQKYKF